ncbi:hypothetical protein [Xanthomonas phaseoli]|uniref:hypothetical protein n=1 Tax=Xanthomonas phaseoli TaxID=1985254 RepID=UPI002226BB8B|nr:hypothetical protein [Xanthomonas phaseoli]UZB29620.1 hypothetical protein OM951_03085 [Xanthomonas phaseoli pv. phaseoli]
MTPHTPRRAPQIGAPLRVMADAASIDARRAMRDNVAPRAICTDADAVRCRQHRRGSTQQSRGDAIRSMCIDLFDLVGSPCCLRRRLCSFDTLAKNMRCDWTVRWFLFQNCWNRIQVLANITET